MWLTIRSQLQPPIFSNEPISRPIFLSISAQVWAARNGGPSFGFCEQIKSFDSLICVNFFLKRRRCVSLACQATSQFPIHAPTDLDFLVFYYPCVYFPEELQDMEKLMWLRIGKYTQYIQDRYTMHECSPACNTKYETFNKSNAFIL